MHKVRNCLFRSHKKSIGDLIPKVSIIIPNYNHAAFLQQRLDSVFNQTFQDFEIILLDDASTDTSKDILNSYKNHPKVSQVAFNDVNSGSPFKQWQKGINLAKGTYIWIAESDDYCELDYLGKIIKKLGSLDICYCQSYDVNENGGDIKSRLSYTSEFRPNVWEHDFSFNGDAFNLNYLLLKNVIPNASAVVFKRNLIKDHFFDSIMLNMIMCGDWLFWIRLNAGNTIGFLHEHLNYFRHHNNISRTHGSLIKKRLRLVEESIIRNEAYVHLGLTNEKKNSFLYDNWFKLHHFNEAFKDSFYDVILHGTSRKTLFLKFIKLKIQKHFRL